MFFINIANEYWCKHFPALDTRRRETDYGYKIRQTWKELGFPKYSIVDEYLSLPKGTTNQYAHKYDYTNIKAKYEELHNQIHLEQQEKEQQEMEEDYSDIWKTARSSIKYRINDLTIKIKKTTNEKELEGLWDKYYEALKELGKIQPTERINKHLPNQYKDDTINKLEIEQKGELDLNHQFNKSIEDLEKEYEDYYNKLQSELEGNQKENNHNNINE